MSTCGRCCCPVYLPVNFTAFVVTAGVHPATDASVDVVMAEVQLFPWVDLVTMTVFQASSFGRAPN